ncbi:MAG: uroporphyrinogen-III C-methyltransferase [Alphaproteobacteria bacterium]|nr:uroporphyrinogen-III C-methyltransferase [Alphaproteobacteria bacterium]
MNAIRKSRSDLTKTSEVDQTVGSVTLVGAGPGAADLMTVRAVRALEGADAIYYDSLVDESVLSHVKPNARRVFVGKRKGFSAMPQQAIQDKMRDDARAGNQVVRLKGGDPFVFGRGGEELADLRADGIPVKVIPGITAAVAAAAEHGIPLTHRDVATSVTFVTGHTLDGSIPELDGLISSKRTLVIYMGVSNAGTIVDQLRGDGVPGSMPVAVIERATLPGQRFIETTLDALAADLISHDVVTPALLVIGNVAALGVPAVEPRPPVHSKPEPNEPFAWVHHPMG